MPSLAKPVTVRLLIKVLAALPVVTTTPVLAVFVCPVIVSAAPVPPEMPELGALRAKPIWFAGTFTVTAPDAVVIVTFLGTRSGKVSPAPTVEGPTTFTVTANAELFPITWRARVIVL